MRAQMSRHASTDVSITSVLACHAISFFSSDEGSYINCRNVGKFLT